MPKSKIDTAIRATVVTLKAYTTKSSHEIAGLTYLSISAVNKIYARIIKRGFEAHHNIIEDSFIEDAPRSS